jgi:hypothetical protein
MFQTGEIRPLLGKARKPSPGPAGGIARSRWPNAFAASANTEAQNNLVADADLFLVPAIIVLIMDGPILEPATGLWRRGWCVVAVAIGKRAADDTAEQAGRNAAGNQAAIAMMVMPFRRWRPAMPIAIILWWRTVILLRLRKTRRGQIARRQCRKDKHRYESLPKHCYLQSSNTVALLDRCELLEMSIFP